MGKVRVIGGMDLRNACAPVFIAAIPYCGIFGIPNMKRAQMSIYG